MDNGQKLLLKWNMPGIVLILLVVYILSCSNNKRFGI